MTWIRKRSGSASMVCVYTCPVHGEFDADVQRDENGEAPDVFGCEYAVNATIEPGVSESGWQCCNNLCGLPATWTPSPTIGCRVRRVEAVKGKWEKPERETYLDTRELGEGQDIEEFQAKRAAVWERKRQEDVMAVKKGFG